VAIKVLNSYLSSNAQIRERFKNEARMMASLDHPNITKVIDFDEQPHQLSIVMELLQGEDLSEKIKRQGSLDEKQIQDIFTQTLSAFQYAHEKGIVHRDIKPSNIFILSSGHVKILDFGIAKLFGQGNEMTQTGTQIGTPFYMSPEQVKSDKSIDHRSDIYSLGVTLYFAINGKPPFNSDTDSQFDIFSKIVYESLPDLPAGSRYSTIIQKACQKNREQRYQSCSEWLNEMNGSVSENITSPIEVKVDLLNNKKTPGFGPEAGAFPMPTKNKLATASLVIGIISLLICWVPVLGFLAGIIALIFGISGQKDPFKNPATNKSQGIAGIVLGVISAIIAVFVNLVFFGGLYIFSNDVLMIDQNGNSIDTVHIGDQIWMSKNLKVVTFINGDSIKEAKTAEEWIAANENKEPAWCYYENNPDNDTVYGKLYNWYAVSDKRELAPEGWHIPTDIDWHQLESHLGKDAGDKVKNEKFGRSTRKIRNESGLNVLPAGARYVDLNASFDWYGIPSVNNYANFWTSTALRIGFAYDSKDFIYDEAFEKENRRSAEFKKNINSKGNGFSVRCIHYIQVPQL
jgi:uncharacterized protein (TIGR02145 family)